MTTAAPSTALVMTQPAFSDAERLALAGFLAGYRGLTREAYALDLRQFTAWCPARRYRPACAGGSPGTARSGTAAPGEVRPPFLGADCPGRSGPGPLGACLPAG